MSCRREEGGGQGKMRWMEEEKQQQRECILPLRWAVQHELAKRWDDRFCGGPRVGPCDIHSGGLGDKRGKAEITAHLCMPRHTTTMPAASSLPARSLPLLAGLIIWQPGDRPTFQKREKGPQLLGFLKRNHFEDLCWAGREPQLIALLLFRRAFRAENGN